MTVPATSLPRISGSLYGQDLLELARPDLLVELVEPGGLHLHEHVVLADHGLGDVRFLQRPLVLADDERLHDSLGPSRLIFLS